MTLRELATSILALSDDDQNQEAMYSNGESVLWNDPITGQELDEPHLDNDEPPVDDISFTRVYDSSVDGYIWLIHG